MARAVSNAEGEDKRRIEEECRSLHKQGVGRWMGCASFCRIFKVLRTDPNGDIVLGMTQTRCPCIVILASVPVVSRWMVRNQDVRLSLTSLRTYVICVRVLSDKRTYVPTHVRTYQRTHTIILNTACSQVRRDRGGAGGRRPAGFAARGRVGGPCRMVRTDQRRGGAAGHRSGVSSPSSCLELCRYERTYGMHGFVAGGSALMYGGATVPTEHLFLSYALAVCTYVLTYLRRAPARTNVYGRTYVPRSVLLRRGAPARRPVPRVAHEERHLRHLVLGETWDCVRVLL